MANILNIDTTSSQCSVALAKDGEIVVGLESAQKMDHSSSLAPYVEKCVDYLKQKNEKLDAVSVSYGPGSYTGVRIGLSLAKGIAFGLDIPLITISTLQVLATRAMFSYPEFSGEEVVVPMIDARRMEVFTAAYNAGLNEIIPQQAMILDSDSFRSLENEDRVLFIGDGSEKFKELYEGNNGVWLGSLLPHAKYMAPLSEIKYKKQEFSDVAYTVPNYLKEYQTTQPRKNPII